MREQQQSDSPAGVCPAREMRRSPIRTSSNALSVDEMGPGHIRRGNVVSVPSSSIRPLSRQDGVDSVRHEENNDSPRHTMEENGSEYLQGTARAGVLEQVVAGEEGGLELRTQDSSPPVESAKCYRCFSH